MRVMMSAAGSPAAVSILRHLRSLGHVVSRPRRQRGYAAARRAFLRRLSSCAPPAVAPGYLDFLCDGSREVDIFLPFIDEELLAIAAAGTGCRYRFATRIAVSDPEIVQDCVDKCRFQRACVEAGLPIAPETNVAPAFFKPRYGRGGKGVIEARDERMFEALRGRDGVLQRAISGQEFTVDAVFDRERTPRRYLRTATHSRRRRVDDRHGRARRKAS